LKLPRRTPRTGNVVRGVLLLARGKAAGIAHFGNSVDSFTASLAPLIAFPLVGTVLNIINGAPAEAIIGFLSRLCAVLAVAAITHEFARVTHREALWLRTATALNWSFWLFIPLLALAGITGAVMVTAGMAMTTAEDILIGLMATYLLWYQWFAVRAGLNLSVLQAIALVILTNAVVALLTSAPTLLAYAFRSKT
jgi:hypothetical protein